MDFINDLFGSEINELKNHQKVILYSIALGAFIDLVLNHPY